MSWGSELWVSPALEPYVYADMDEANGRVCGVGGWGGDAAAPFFIFIRR